MVMSAARRLRTVMVMVPGKLSERVVPSSLEAASFDGYLVEGTISDNRGGAGKTKEARNKKEPKGPMAHKSLHQFLSGGVEREYEPCCSRMTTGLLKPPMVATTPDLRL